MNSETASFHASEPCHLTLSELMYSDFKLTKQLIKGKFTYDIFCHKFIFKTIINKVFRSNSFIQNVAYLINHTIIKSLSQTTRYFGTSFITINIETNDKRWNRRQLSLRHWVMQVMFLYFNSTNSTLTRVDI